MMDPVVEDRLACPNGCADVAVRYRKPVVVPQLGIVRRHKCMNCRHVYMSIQHVVSEQEAAQILKNIGEA
jgi:hypothetical protein